MSTPLCPSHKRLSKWDLILAVCLFTAVFLLSVFSITNTGPWGDDFAAYILQGISIAEGNFEEQIRLNHLLHPSYMPDEAVNGELVYVWGYSLLLALVYRIVGFDRVGYSSIIYYKLPTVLALALMAAIVYLFLRRRFGRQLSLTVAVLYSLCAEFCGFLDCMYSDLVSLFFMLLVIYLNEVFLDAQGKKKLLLAVLLGVGIWFMYEIRLSGVSILLICALTQLRQLYRHRKEQSLRTQLLLYLSVYALFLLLKLLSEAILAPATPNSSDLKDTGPATIFWNLVFYADKICNWIGSIWNRVLSGALHLGLFCGGAGSFFFLQSALTVLTVALCLLGVLRAGFREEFPYTVFFGVYLLVTCMLNYNQGLRYAYPLLPLIALYFAHGCALVSGWLSRFVRLRVPLRVVSIALCCLLCLSEGYMQYLRIAEVQRNPGRDSGFSSLEDSAINNAYSDSAVEAYEYVNAHIPPDKSVGFFKPRLLYLNTGRVSFLPADLLGHGLDQADYYLVYRHIIINPQPTEDFAPIWANEDFTLYQKQLP